MLDLGVSSQLFYSCVGYALAMQTDLLITTDCYVDGEEVKPQPGDFYGGWTTSDLEGMIKGCKETRWM